VNDLTDVRLIDAELSRQSDYALTRCGSRADLANIVIGQPPIPVVERSRHPSLGRSISVVVGLCSKEEMLWIHATRLVAPMKNAKPIGNLAMMENPREAMRQPGLISWLLRRANSKFTVALTVYGTCPKPAAIRSIDKAPESFGSAFGVARLGANTDRASKIVGHREILSRCRGRGVHSTAGHYHVRPKPIKDLAYVRH